MKHKLNRDTITAALIVSLLLIPLALLGAYVAQKHMWGASQLESLSPRYARMEGVLLSKEALDKAAAESQNRLALYVYSSAQDVTQAGNDAQQRIRAVFSAAGLDVVSSQVLPAKKDAHFDRIALAVRLEGELLGLQSALAVLPSLTPVVLIDAMNVQTVGVQRADRPQRLAIQFNLSVLRARAS